MICRIESCGARVFARGWCARHYTRWHRHGDPTAGGPTHRPHVAGQLCGVDGCSSPVRARGLCNHHYLKLWRHGDPTIGQTRRAAGSGSIRPDGYIVRQEDGRLCPEHVRVAERALGKPLPPGALVHHVDEDRANNKPTNLVICPSHAYHMLIHQRMRALDACGNAAWRKCGHCKEYDDPIRLHFSGGRNIYHPSCERQYQREYRATKGT